MEVVLISIAILVFILGIYACFKGVQWISKSRFRVRFAIVAMLFALSYLGIRRFFFKNMTFIQSKVYSNLYLVKYPDNNDVVLKASITEIIKKRLMSDLQNENQLSYSNRNAIYFYEYYNPLSLNFINKSGTVYFIKHEEDLGGFVSEELGMYTNYRLAEFYYKNCNDIDANYCGKIDYFKNGEYLLTDSLFIN
ncbi:hypothetical protein BWZ20_04570 [Winogradskyella sp. J14-2]|uniref:hypothetical protein n=1 Tax=Winogradskyella sp. J14-2 TaxID=1936080 RepID=UPI000972DE72|nr:hypothetical protein [Winogradskyella sp. J14-2]APY07616.1 hypothetical protein BWZ20_04570 [Winogradskyella sp. J14-2]